jgi:hypothetical protein
MAISISVFLGSCQLLLPNLPDCLPYRFTDLAIAIIQGVPQRGQRFPGKTTHAAQGNSRPGAHASLVLTLQGFEQDRQDGFFRTDTTEGNSGPPSDRWTILKQGRKVRNGGRSWWADLSKGVGSQCSRRWVRGMQTLDQGGNCFGANLTKHGDSPPRGLGPF